MNLFVFLIFIFPVFTFAFDCEKSPFLAEVTDVLSEVSAAWAPFYVADSCEMKNQPLQCQNYFSRPEFKDLNWKQYAQACSLSADISTDIIDFTIGCFAELKDFGIFLGESGAQQTLDQIKLKECNSSEASKKKLVDDYNKAMPKVLKYIRPINFASTTCETIQSSINRFHYATKQKWLTKIPFYIKETELTPDEKQFKKWIELKYAKSTMSQMAPTVFAELEETLKTATCYNTFYKSKLFCTTLFSLTGIRQTYKLSKDIVHQRNLLNQSKAETKALEEKMKSQPNLSLNKQQREALIKKNNDLEKELNLD